MNSLLLLYLIAATLLKCCLAATVTVTTSWISGAGQVGGLVGVYATNISPTVNISINTLVFSEGTLNTTLTLTPAVIVLGGAVNNLIATWAVPCAYNAGGVVTVTLLDIFNTTQGSGTFNVGLSIEYLPKLRVSAPRDRAGCFVAGEIVQFSLIPKCSNYTAFVFQNLTLVARTSAMPDYTIDIVPAITFTYPAGEIFLKDWSIPPSFCKNRNIELILSYTLYNGGDDSSESISEVTKICVKCRRRDCSSSSSSSSSPSCRPPCPVPPVRDWCKAHVRASIITGDNRYFIYPARTEHVNAARICNCFFMDFAGFSNRNLGEVLFNVQRTVGDSTLWIRDFEGQYVGTRLAIRVEGNKAKVIQTPAGTSHYVLCRPRLWQ